MMASKLLITKQSKNGKRFLTKKADDGRKYFGNLMTMLGITQKGIVKICKSQDKTHTHTHTHARLSIESP